MILPDDRPAAYKPKPLLEQIAEARQRESSIKPLPADHPIAGKSLAQLQIDLAEKQKVFPLPGGEIPNNDAAGLIFRKIADSHRLFIRGGSVCEVIHSQADPQMMQLEAVTPARFCSVVETFGHRVAKLVTVKNDKGEERSFFRTATMPKGTAEVLLASDAARVELPTIRQLVPTPILANIDGIPVLLGKGYHDFAGGTFVTSRKEIPEMTGHQAAVTIIKILRDFDFVTDSDLARAVAALLSPAMKFGQWITDDFPLDLAEADQSQSGKTFRLKLTAAIYGATLASIQPNNGGVGSLDESVSDALLKGNPFILLDNVRGRIDSPVLESAIRGSGSVNARGLRKGGTVDTRPFLWYVSTNGAELTRDLANRSIVTRIRKLPGDYKYQVFEHGGDIMQEIVNHQPIYLGAVHAIIREWARLGMPRTDENRHDFRGWVQPMDWIVQKLCELSPLMDGHREQQLRTCNPKLQWLRDVAKAAIVGEATTEPMTTTELLELAGEASVAPPGGRALTIQTAGGVLASIFKENGADQLTVDGCVITRTKQSIKMDNGNYREQQFYQFHTVHTNGQQGS